MLEHSSRPSGTKAHVVLPPVFGKKRSESCSSCPVALEQLYYWWGPGTSNPSGVPVPHYAVQEARGGEHPAQVVPVLAGMSTWSLWLGAAC